MVPMDLEGSGNLAFKVEGKAKTTSVHHEWRRYSLFEGTRADEPDVDK